MEYKKCYHAERRCELDDNVSCDNHGLLTRLVDAKIGNYQGKLKEIKLCPKYVTRESQLWRDDYRFMNKWK